MLKGKTFWIGVAISIGLLALVFIGTDINALANVFRTVNYVYILPALILYFMGVGLRAARWHFLLRSIKSISIWRLFQVTVIGYAANDVLPLRIGELVRAFLLGELEQISKAAVLVTIVLERVFDGLTMVLFIGMASFFLPLPDYARTLLSVGSGLFVVMVLILIVVASLRERLDRLARPLLDKLPDKWAGRGEKLLDSLLQGLSVLRNPVDALAALGFSIGAWLLEASMYLVLALGFGITLPYPVFVLTTAVANLVTIVPSTPGYVGVFDAPVRGILALFGVDANVAVGYTLLLHSLLILPVVLLGLIFTWRLGMSFTQLSRRSETTLEKA